MCRTARFESSESIGSGHRNWRVMIIGGAICTRLLQQVLSIGCPTVAGATVTGTVVKEAKAKKVIVYKYKRKSGYHKKNGHRQLFTEIKIDKINA